MKSSKLPDKTPLYRQIYRHFRDAILSGQLLPGAHIAASSVLAKQFGAAVDTVQTAMAALEAEGLIERSQRKGSFVKGNTPRLSSVGIFYDNIFWQKGSMDYYRVLSGQLQQLLSQEKIAFRLFPEPHNSAKIPSDLITSASRLEVQAVLVPLIVGISQQEFDALGVPVVFQADAINYDLRSLVDQTVSYFLRNGCKTAGLITTTTDDHPLKNLYLNALQKAGLQTNEQWISTPPVAPDAWEMEEFGYRSFCAMKNAGAEGSLPDGLLIYPDTPAKGAMLGITQHNIRIPQDLKLVMHSNAGMEYFMPFQPALIQNDPALAAAKMLELARRRVAGENPQPFATAYKLIEPSA